MTIIIQNTHAHIEEKIIFGISFCFACQYVRWRRRIFIDCFFYLTYFSLTRFVGFVSLCSKAKITKIVGMIIWGKASFLPLNSRENAFRSISHRLKYHLKNSRITEYRTMGGGVRKELTVALIRSAMGCSRMVSE